MPKKPWPAAVARARSDDDILLLMIWLSLLQKSEVPKTVDKAVKVLQTRTVGHLRKEERGRMKTRAAPFCFLVLWTNASGQS